MAFSGATTAGGVRSRTEGKARAGWILTDIVIAYQQTGRPEEAKRGAEQLQAETVRLIFRLARGGDGTSGPMGVKSITKHLNAVGNAVLDGVIEALELGLCFGGTLADPMLKDRIAS